MATRACEVNISTMNEEGAATARLAPTMPLPGTAPEVTVRSALLGLLLGVVFAGATSFIALKLGEGIEPAIPIAVMVVGLAAATGRKATTLQNLNAVTVGATSGAVGVGAAFTVPALFILGLGHSAGVAALVLLPLAGAALGVLFLLPLRRYFVAELHGKLPFPEAVAITETLIASDQGGGRARVLMRAMAAAFGIDLASTALGLWKDTFSTADFPALSALTDRAKLVFSMNTSAAMLGIGYLIGLRYAVIICAGSALTWFVIVPVAAQMHPEFATLGAVDIFDRFARDIGIGAVCAAGFIGTVRMAPAMLGALRQVGREFVEHRTSGSTPLAADRDLSLPLVVALIAAIAALLWLYFRLELSWTPYPGWVATAVVTVTLVTAFLFAAISAWSTAMMASTPLSGLTLTALIAAALVLRLLGVAGPQAMVAVVGIGAVVCTCQSMASTIVSEWKVGHTLGSSPRIISASNLLGSVVAAAVVGGVMLFSYFVWRQDFVGVLGQSTGIVIYARNLRLIYKHRRRLREEQAARPGADPVGASSASPARQQ